MKPPPYAAGSEGDHFAEFCSKHLIQSIDRWDGEPLELYPDQRRFYNEALAFDEHGLPIWASVLNLAPRKNGKTVSCAAYGLYRLLTSEGSPEILLAAASDKQAGRLFDAAAAFVRRSPELSKLLHVRDYLGEIRREDGRGRILRMASDPGKLYGYNPSLVVVDELAQFETPNLRRAFEALVSGSGARSAPQVFAITTAGSAQTRHDSILGRIVDGAEQATDADREPGLLIARMPEAQTLCWIHEAPTTDPRDAKALKLANPAPWITEDFLAKQAADPQLSDAAVLQLHGCVWAESEDAWLPAGAWAKRAASIEVEPGAKVVLGFDGSYKRDATALIGCTLDGHLFVVAIWERPDGAGDDWRIPRREVEATIAEAMERYEVVELACDPPGWHREIEDWSEAYEVVLEFETKQADRMVPACDRFRSAVIEGGLTHDGDPDLARHVGNAVVKEGRSGMVLAKPTYRRKIDAAVAAIVAFDRASWHRDNPTKPAVPMIGLGGPLFGSAREPVRWVGG